MSSVPLVERISALELRATDHGTVELAKPGDLSEIAQAAELLSTRVREKVLSLCDAISASMREGLQDQAREHQRTLHGYLMALDDTNLLHPATVDFYRQQVAKACDPRRDR